MHAESSRNGLQISDRLGADRSAVIKRPHASSSAITGPLAAPRAKRLTAWRVIMFLSILEGSALSAQTQTGETEGRRDP